MVSFVETDDPRHFAAIAAGAESNVAIGMARLGLRTRWVSRIGDDPLGRLVEESVASSGVDVSVIRDPERVTGVMVKHPSGPEKISSYYRSESAARLLDPTDLQRAGSAPLIHVTGITPALSQSALGLVQAVVGRVAGLDSTVSFDFNYRAKLWPDAEMAATVLLPLARDADVVFIGDDEARLLFGSTSPVQVTRSPPGISPPASSSGRRKPVCAWVTSWQRGSSDRSRTFRLRFRTRN